MAKTPRLLKTATEKQQLIYKGKLISITFTSQKKW
jgi:hypothetical protein